MDPKILFFKSYLYEDIPYQNLTSSANITICDDMQINETLLFDTIATLDNIPFSIFNQIDQSFVMPAIERNCFYFSIFKCLLSLVLTRYFKH